MYKPETIKKLMIDAKQLYDEYMNIDVKNIKLCISNGNRKIGKVMNVSLMPVMTCANCKECKHYCYDIKACIQYRHNVLDARIRNTVLMRKDIHEYFKRIDDKMTRRKKNKFFRFHVAGDIVSKEYLACMIELAKRHPEFIIWTYTKNYSVVNDYVRANGNNCKKAMPNNLHIMFSEWDGMQLDNPFEFPIFTVKMANGNKNHDASYFNKLYKCPGNCDICKNDNLGCIGGMDTYADEH